MSSLRSPEDGEDCLVGSRVLIDFSTDKNMSPSPLNAPFKGKVYVSERLWGLRRDVSKCPAEPRLEDWE